MPPRPPLHKPMGYRPWQEASKEAKRAHDRKRGSAAKRGYDKDWRKLRDAHLRRHPLCVMCADEGAITPAGVVDHIVSFRDDPDRRLDPDNLRSLCKAHHDWRTGRDQAFGRGYSILPDWLEPSRIPLTIICGPPGSGKTAYASDHAGPHDITIDLDQIKARLSGKRWYEAGNEWLGPAIRERNAMLASLAKNPRHHAAWLIVSAPTARERNHWRTMLHPTRVVVLETSAGVCEARIAQDSRCSQLAHLYGQAAQRWWQRYEKDERDTVL